MVWFILAILAGVALPVQAGVNSQLRGALGHPALAATVSFFVGSAALAIYVVAARLAVPAGAVNRTLWWHWSGGLIGAFFIACAIVLAPRLGAATLVGAVVAGQMLASLALDHFGLVGYPQHPLNLWRVAGVALVLAGVFLIQRN